MTLDDALSALPVVAILRGVRPDEILDHAQIIYDAGIRGIEVPLNSPSPFDTLRRLADAFGDSMAVGAGTVLTSARVDEVAAAGGKIIVAPNTNPDVIRRALVLGLDPAPGFSSATEAFTALDAGARHLKLFPAVTYGPEHLRQLRAVLPTDLSIWAVGGVGPDAMAVWRAAGANAFGLGGEIYRAGQTLTETADKATRVVAAARALTA